MPKMVSRFGDIVEIPQTEVNRALASGYTYVSASQPSPQQSQPVLQPQPSSQPQPVNSARNALSGRLAGIAAQLDAGQSINRISLTPQDVNDLYIAGYTAIQAPGYSTGDVYNITSKGGQTGQNYTPEEIKKASMDAIAEYAASHPPVSNISKISQAELDAYLNQARATVDPEFLQYFNQTKQDLLQGFQQLGQDVATSERQLESKYGQQLGSLQEQMAQRGLTFSSRRQEAERTLAESTQAAIDAGRREAERRALTLGQAGERQLGSANLPELPGINQPPTPILNKPGEFTFAKPTGTRSLFTPTSGYTGELAYKQKAATADLYNTYVQGEREKRGLVSSI